MQQQSGLNMAIFRSVTFYLGMAGIAAAALLIAKLTVPPPVAVHLLPPINPFEHTIAASAIIEAVDKNIEIGTPVSGLIKEMHVQVGEKVEEGQILFRIDDRDLHASLLVQRANAAVARANHLRVVDQLSRLESIEDPRAISQEELNTKRSDAAVGLAQVEAAEAQITHTILMLDRLCILAPSSGTILQSNIRKGEFVQSGGAAAMILGNLLRLHVRADIDEESASHVVPHAKASAFPKNSSSIEIPLRFERIEPYVIPKRSLTGKSDEKVDTRVLQVIYSFDSPISFPLYVGQQVDVFIERPVTKKDADAVSL